MAEESILKLHADVAWVLALVWIAKAGRSGEPQAQVHYYTRRSLLAPIREL
jgi:hypothetical protein